MVCKHCGRPLASIYVDPKYVCAGDASYTIAGFTLIAS